MLLPSQIIVPGKLVESWLRERDNLVSVDAVSRLWAKDVTLWPRAPGQEQFVRANLAWLDLPDQVGPYMNRVATLAAVVEREGFKDVVFIAMGDSNLAAESVSRTAAERRPQRFFLIDSTDPAAIRAVDEKLNLGVTVFIFANKSGKRIETHALLLYFLERLRAQDAGEPGRCFVAVTEDGSYLSELARNYGFLGCFLDPPGIKGRYSSLIHFGLLLSALWRSDPQVLVSRAVAMRDLCRQSAANSKNPALDLAALLAAGAIEGSDKLLLIATESLRPSTYRIGQLVGASMSRKGRGLIPVCEELPKSLEIYKRSSLAVSLTMQGDDDAAVKTIETQLKQAGVPTVSIALGDAEDLGAELFKWEIATALACASLNVNPFDEPDVQEGRGRVSEMLETLVVKHQWPAHTVRVRDKDIELYAEGETRQEISTLNLSEALRTFFEARNPDGYLAIITFAGGSPSTDAALEALRDRLEARLSIPVLLSSGPRYLRYFEQVYKGGPPNGLFLILTSESTQDIAIPGAGYTFGQLQLALALSDFESLQSRKKLAVRLHLTQGLAAGLAELEQIARKL